jgi:hypothetical protein
LEACSLETLIARDRGLSIVERATAGIGSLDVGIQREGVRGAGHLKILVTLLVVEDVVDLLPPLSLHLLEGHVRIDRAVLIVGSARNTCGCILAARTLFDKVGSGAVAGLVVLLMEIVHLNVPVFCQAVETHDLLTRQIKPLLHLRIVEGAETLILHLQLLEPFSLQWVVEEVACRVHKLLIELSAELGESGISLGITQIGGKLGPGRFVLLQGVVVGRTELREVLLIEAHAFCKARVAKQGALSRIRETILVTLVRKTYATAGLSVAGEAHTASGLRLLGVTAELSRGRGDIAVAKSVGIADAVDIDIVASVVVVGAVVVIVVVAVTVIAAISITVDRRSLAGSPRVIDTTSGRTTIVVVGSGSTLRRRRRACAWRLPRPWSGPHTTRSAGSGWSLGRTCSRSSCSLSCTRGGVSCSSLGGTCTSGSTSATLCGASRSATTRTAASSTTARGLGDNGSRKDATGEQCRRQKQTWFG